MPQPILLISRNRVKPEQFDDILEHYLERIPTVEDHKPGTLIELAYADKGKSEFLIIRLFRDGLPWTSIFKGQMRDPKPAINILNQPGLRSMASQGNFL